MVKKKYPCMALGTFQRTYDELLSLFKAYPYNKMFIDTAYRYENEDSVSEAINDSGYPKENIAYIGKICFAQQTGNSSVENELKRTLKRLMIDTIDVYMIHSSRYERYVDTWSQIIDLKEKGFIRSIGVSNFTIEALESLLIKTGICPDIVQVVYNPLNENSKTKEIIEYCNNHQIAIEAAMPFGGKESLYAHSECFREEIIKKLLNRNIISIIGTSNERHMLENFSVLERVKYG